MLAFFLNMTVGKWIVVVCAILFCFVTIIFLRDLLTKKKEEPKPISPEESEKAKLEPVLLGSLQKTHQLEDVINQKITSMKLDLMAERLRSRTINLRMVVAVQRCPQAAAVVKSWVG